MWGRTLGGKAAEVGGQGRPAGRSVLQRQRIDVRAVSLEDLEQTSTLTTVSTSSGRRIYRASGAAKVLTLPVLAAAATSVVKVNTTGTTVKAVTVDTKSPTTRSRSAVNQIATSSATTSATATPTQPPSVTVSTKSTTTANATSSATAIPSSYTIPRAFDSTLGTNFTSTACPSFFATFLADPDFIQCAPFALLLATSSAFFKAQQSPSTLLPYVMDATCAANRTSCAAVMDGYAGRIKEAGTCGPDLVKRNPLVVQALSGFENYEMMYQAGCLRDEQTDEVSVTSSA